MIIGSRTEKIYFNEVDSILYTASFDQGIKIIDLNQKLIIDKLSFNKPVNFYLSFIILSLYLKFMLIIFYYLTKVVEMRFAPNFEIVLVKFTDNTVAIFQIGKFFHSYQITDKNSVGNNL